MGENTRQPPAASGCSRKELPSGSMQKNSSGTNFETPSLRPKFRVIAGGNQRRERELTCRGDVVRLLAAAAAEMMLRKISPLRAHEIQRRAVKIMILFEKKASSENDAELSRILSRELRQLETIWRERIKGGKKR